MVEQDNIRLAKEAIDAINAHDIERYLTYVDDSYVGESETTGLIHGRKETQQMLTTMFQAFPDFHLEIEQTFASGDQVVVRVIVSGTHKGSFAGVAPTNKKVSWHSCNFLQLYNGKAIRSRIYADNVSLFRQLGVLPAPKATTAG